MKDTFGGKIMTKFFRLRANTYSYLIDDGSEKAQKSMLQKENLNLRIIKTV